jgi:hypothetical protein
VTDFAVDGEFEGSLDDGEGVGAGAGAGDVVLAVYVGEALRAVFSG